MQETQEMQVQPLGWEDPLEYEMARETRPSSTVSLTSQRHPEKLPEATSTIRVRKPCPAQRQALCPLLSLGWLQGCGCAIGVLLVR